MCTCVSPLTFNSLFSLLYRLSKKGSSTLDLSKEVPRLGKDGMHYCEEKETTKKRRKVEQPSSMRQLHSSTIKPIPIDTSSATPVQVDKTKTELPLKSPLDQEHVFGNFRNYYSFRKQDNRADLLPWASIKGVCASYLDVGCNAGVLTNAMAQYLDKGTFVMGTDIDKVLIEQAQLGFPSIPFQIDYPTRTFDLVSCFSTTMWVHINQ